MPKSANPTRYAFAPVRSRIEPAGKRFPLAFHFGLHTALQSLQSYDHKLLQTTSIPPYGHGRNSPVSVFYFSGFAFDFFIGLCQTIFGGSDVSPIPPSLHVSGFSCFRVFMLHPIYIFEHMSSTICSVDSKFLSNFSISRPVYVPAFCFPNAISSSFYPVA